MKPYRKSTDGIGVTIWWYENGCRIVKQPAVMSLNNRTIYHCEIAMFGAAPRGWDYHQSPTQLGPDHNSWMSAYSDVLRADEIRQAWHGARRAVSSNRKVVR